MDKLYIDMNPLLRAGAVLQKAFSLSSGERHLVSRVSVRTTVFPIDGRLFDIIYLQLGEWILGQSWREALDWQADPYDEVEDWQVHRNLHRRAATMMSCYDEESRRRSGLPMPACTVLTASAEIPTVGNLAQGRPLSSFRRHSFRAVTQEFYLPFRLRMVGDSIETNRLPVDTLPPDLDDVIGRSSLGKIGKWMAGELAVVFSLLRGGRERDGGDPILPPSSRSPQEDTSERPGHAKSSQFTGVRYRYDNKKWTVEIRRRKNEKKVWIGDFKTEAEAARVINAAHYHYGRRDRLNFEESLQLLSLRPKPAAPLDDKAKLKFVKEEAKWLASDAHQRPSSPTVRAAREIVESSEGRLAATFELRSFSEIVAETATDSADEVGDAGSQLHHSNLMPDFCAIGVQAMDHDMGASMVSLMLEDSPAAGATATIVPMSGFQMLPDFLRRSPSPLQDSLLRSPSPAAVLQMDNPLGWLGNVEDLQEQEADEIWRTIGQ